MSNIRLNSQKLKSETLSVRCSANEKKELEKRAGKNNQTVSAYLLEKGLEKRKYTRTAKVKKKTEQLVRGTEIAKCLKLNMKLNYADQDSYDLLEELEGILRTLWDC